MSDLREKRYQSASFSHICCTNWGVYLLDSSSPISHQMCSDFPGSKGISAPFIRNSASQDLVLLRHKDNTAQLQRDLPWISSSKCVQWVFHFFNWFCCKKLIIYSSTVDAEKYFLWPSETVKWEDKILKSALTITVKISSQCCCN